MRAPTEAGRGASFGKTAMENAKLRPIEAIPIESKGESLVALRDPLGISQEVLALPAQFYFVLTLLDGTHSCADIQGAYSQRFGTLLLAGQVQNLIRQLDANYLLDNERFWQRFGTLKEEFRRLSIRPATCTPSAYSADRDECAKQFEAFLGPAREKSSAATDGLCAMVVPHIDIARGMSVYGEGYALVEQLEGVELFVIFGTCHGGMEHLFALTEKDWVSPFGKISSGGDIVRDIAERCSADVFADEYSHKAEHSIEIQVAILSYLFRETRKFSIVPILCGSFDHFAAKRMLPDGDPEFQEFMGALGEALTADSRKRLFVAGADLAHIGPRFGDTKPLTEEKLKAVERADKESLVHLASADAEGLFQSLAVDQHERRVCGLSPMISMLHAAQPTKGRILAYEQWIEDNKNSSVSFASVALYE